MEILNSMSELSHRGKLLCSRASLLLADITCIQGTESVPLNTDGSHVRRVIGEEMVDIFKGLKNNLKNQVQTCDR